MRRFKPSVAVVAIGLVLSASLAVASKPLSGGVSTTERLPEKPAYKATIQAGIHGFVGVDLEIVPNLPPSIMRVIPYSPSERAGLQVGDKLLSADNQSLIGLSRQATDDAISDQIDHVITFQVQRGRSVFAVWVTVCPPPRL